ncbi:MAG TPA: FKBP-type peptidyl-prolyl cis-trans isomerase [Verrucomicrobiae bacterium]
MSPIILGMGVVTGAAGAPEAGPLQTDKEKLSYAMGMSVGLQIQKYSAGMNPAVFHQAIQDLKEGKEPRLSLKEAAAIVKEWQEKAKQEQITFHGPQIQAFQELGAKNKRQGEAFLAENKTREGVVALESGLQYKVVKAGDGPRPTADDIVVCNYRGTLLDGKEFDSTFKRKEPATLALPDLIPGWAQALQLMSVGSHWQLFLPDKLAFGDHSPGGSIGPNATLLLDVELLDIKERPEVSAKDKPAPEAKAAELSKGR